MILSAHLIKVKKKQLRVDGHKDKLQCLMVVLVYVHDANIVAGRLETLFVKCSWTWSHMGTILDS